MPKYALMPFLSPAMANCPCGSQIAADALAPDANQNFYRPVKLTLERSFLESDGVKIPESWHGDHH